MKNLALYMQLKYKPAIEIAEEEAINTLFLKIRYHEIQKQLIMINTVLGVSMCKKSFNQEQELQLNM